MHKLAPETVVAYERLLDYVKVPSTQRPHYQELVANGQEPVAKGKGQMDAIPLGLGKVMGHVTQGSQPFEPPSERTSSGMLKRTNSMEPCAEKNGLATPGEQTQSRWDW